MTLRQSYNITEESQPLERARIQGQNSLTWLMSHDSFENPRNDMIEESQLFPKPLKGHESCYKYGIE